MGTFADQIDDFATKCDKELDTLAENVQ